MNMTRLIKNQWKYPNFLSQQIRLLYMGNRFYYIFYSFNGFRQRGKVQWTVNYTGTYPKFYYHVFLDGPKTFLLFQNSSVQTLQPIVIVCRRGNFVYQNARCTSIYRPLSYPFRYLTMYCTGLLCSFWYHPCFFRKN